MPQLSQLYVSALVLAVSLLSVQAVPFYDGFMQHILTPPQQHYQPQLPFARFDQQEQRHFAPEQLQTASSNYWTQYAKPSQSLYPAYRTFDGETEFIPLERQAVAATPQVSNVPQAVAQPSATENPFAVDVISGEIGGGAQQHPGIFFHQSFPFFGQDIFNTFGGFGVGAGPNREPWWKGPNVCTDKVEDEDQTKPAGERPESPEDGPAQLFGQFHFSVNSCVEKPNKYVCTRIVNRDGKKKTLTITRQCCHGYKRARNADFSTPCEKYEVKDAEQTAADMGAKEFVVSAKSAGLSDMMATGKNITMFVPLDAAFSSYNVQMQNENNLVDSSASKDLYLRHIVQGQISLDDVSNDEILKTQAAGQTIRINAYKMPPTLGPEPYRYTANCVPVVKHDKDSEQGLIHSLTAVLKPVNKSVMDIIRERPNLSIMRTVLETTKLSELLEGEKPVTIFVPTDDAFDKLEIHLRRALKEGKGCAANILKNHMLDLTLCSAASIPGAKTTAYNLLGEALRLNRTKAESEAADLAGEQPIVINNVAKILEADLMGSNGVLHIIDTILPTESALPMSTLMQEKNVTIFKRLVEAAGLDEKFDDMDNVTLFAPTDKALEDSKWAQMLNSDPEKLQNNDELVEFINYHVAVPMTKTCDLKEQLMDTVNGNKVRVNLYSTHALFSNVMNRATVNCARLVHFDDESCGSVLHQVDKPLAHPKMNLLELLESNPNYSEFLKLIKSANLSDLLSNMQESYTILVPKNEIFQELGEWEKSLTKDQSQLENLIKTHIVHDVVCCAGIIPTNWPFVRSIESLNGIPLRISRDRRPKVENAGITKCDNIAQNGIIHEINDVIVPPRRRAQRPQGGAFLPQQPQQDNRFDDLFFNV